MSLNLTFFGMVKFGKAILRLNQVPHHEDVWGSGGVAPHIFNVGTRPR